MLILLAVPASADAPHAQIMNSKGETWYRYPVRHESTTHFLAEGELAARYETRLRSHSARLDQMRQLADANHSSVAGGAIAKARLSVVTTPINVGGVPINDELARRWERRGMDFHSGTWSFGVAPALHTTSGTQIIQRGVRFKCIDGAIEIHADGTAAFAVAMDLPDNATALNLAGADAAPLDGEFLFVRIAAMIAYGAAWASEGCGTAGDLLVSVRLNVLSSHGTQRKMVLTGALEGAKDIIPLVGTEGQINTIRCDLTTSIEQHLDKPTSRWVAETRRLLSDLTQSLGLAGPHTMTADGAMRRSSWSLSRREQMSNWANRHQIAIV